MNSHVYTIYKCAYKDAFGECSDWSRAFHYHLNTKCYG